MNAVVSSPNGAAMGLRLALFSGNYNYTRDGANQALNRLVRFLIERGATVRVYSPTSPTPAFEPAGDLVSVPSLPIPWRSEYRLSLPFLSRIRADVERFAPTMIHTSAPDVLGWRATTWARELGVPVASSLHTLFETYLGYYRLDRFRPKVEAYLRAFYGRADILLAPSRLMADHLSRHEPRAPIRLWRRGIDRSQFSPERRSEDERRAMGLRAGDVGVLFLGRIVQEKGLDAFAATFDRLRGHPHLRPVIIGDGPARKWLERRLPDAIFTGFLTGERLGRAVANCDLMLNPSRTETFGNATLEAMASGLPIVAPDVPSTRELVRDGVDGYVATGDEPDYASLVLRLADDPQLRRKAGAAARQASERFNWEASCSAVLDAYRELGAAPRFASAAGHA